MDTIFPIDQFEQVILVDLTPSLCQVARERFAKRGWKNVTVICQDAATFQVQEAIEGRVGLVTVSYARKYQQPPVKGLLINLCVYSIYDGPLLPSN